MRTKKTRGSRCPNYKLLDIHRPTHLGTIRDHTVLVWVKMHSMLFAHWLIPNQVIHVKSPRLGSHVRFKITIVDENLFDMSV